ncbi:MAG TPA: HD domain-containing phosphohydrolase [Oligoflexia bacterium]|nr:HD domain-containing phosphohydrolase [Oligoflexia bacterium]HMR23761.1 HD domain-containing phosphohydrolase [Oligoflexia bacterium]
MTQLSEKDFHDLLTIGVALGTQKNLSDLLHIILEKGKDILRCQKASFFYVDSSSPITSKQLVYFSLQHKQAQLTFPIDNHSLAGYVASHKCLLNIEDVHQLESDLPFNFNPRFDHQGTIKSISLLSAPLLDHEGKLIGVLQFFNKLSPEKNIISFNQRDEFILKSLSNQAAVSIVSAKSNEDIKNLFEGFIRASVTAIESRDPTTSGHSERVAKLTLSLSQEVNDINHGQFKNINFDHSQFRQIEFAALLHDFGKIGVREHILSKANKLYPHELPAIFNELDLILNELTLYYAQLKIDHLEQYKKVDIHLFAQFDLDVIQMKKNIDQLKTLLTAANQPGETTKHALEKIEKLLELIKESAKTTRIVVNQDQLQRLKIESGTLTQAERLQIQEHVTNSFMFLQRIPWTRSFEKVPEIAFSHHEKIDGSGYPRGLKGNQIPLESRIMTVADIFDALVSLDRPYKKALPIKDALTILKQEAARQKIELDLVNLFIQKNVYKATHK